MVLRNGVSFVFGLLATACVAGSETDIVEENSQVLRYSTASTSVQLYDDVSAQFPYVVRLSNGCSGVLIGSRTVLTDHHCVQDGSVAGGSIDPSTVGSSGVRVGHAASGRSG